MQHPRAKGDQRKDHDQHLRDIGEGHFLQLRRHLQDTDRQADGQGRAQDGRRDHQRIPEEPVDQPQRHIGFHVTPPSVTALRIGNIARRNLQVWEGNGLWKTRLAQTLSRTPSRHIARPTTDRREIPARPSLNMHSPVFTYNFVNYHPDIYHG